ncbi:LamB/YcsF family protein [Sodalis sp. RH21]|uniref:LamB/YcsF family protein n=1 Tax=unclassified Sodalis (in: enterobacteria) TaxID=2636512 RepID=UPI0039B4A9BA
MLIDLNSDMGESFGAWNMGEDEKMLGIVTSANIACGFHAGDPDVMFATLEQAKINGVGAGAHPGFNDIQGFGRRQITGDSPAQIERQIIYQIGALKALADSIGHPLRHVKTHGALGNMAAEDAGLAMAVARAIYAVDRDLLMVVMPGMETEKAGEKMGLRLVREIYADRAYADNGNLVSRKLPGAVLHDPEQAATRIMRMLESQAIITLGGKRLKSRIDSICVHGDTPGAVAMAGRLRALLEKSGVTVAPMARVIDAAG